MLLSSYVMPLKTSGGGVDPQTLADNMEGGVGVSVDLNQGETKVSVGLDLTGGAAGKVLKIDSTGEDVEWGDSGAEVFIATYNVTSFADISTAINAGKLVMLKDSGARYGTLYAPVVIANSGLVAFGITQNEMNYYVTVSSSDAWNRGSWEIERTNNKKTTISGNESSNTYYPTTKAVADALSDKQDTLDSTSANPNVIAPLYVSDGELRIEIGNGVKVATDTHAVEVKAGKGVRVDASGTNCEGVEYYNNTTVQTNPLKFIQMTAAQYAAITPDADTFYIIIG